MDKKKAFTLAEILICLVIIGVIAAFALSSIKGQKFDEKAQIASLYKALEVVEEASANIITNETTSLPMGVFMTSSVNGNDFSVYSGSSLANISQIFDLYKKYIKFETVDGFCKYSGYCSGSTTGGKMVGGIAVGFEKYDKITDCPSVYQPESNTKTAKTKFNAKTGANETEKCWGRIIIDTNADSLPNKEGSDIFIYGLGASGIVR